MEQDRLVTVAEFAKAFGLSRYLADALVHSGQVPTIRCGKLPRVSLRHARIWLDSAFQKNVRRRSHANKSAAA
jgi:hypothetical protein